MKLLVMALALTAFGLVVFEVAMHPNSQQRVGASLTFGLTAAGIAGAASLLPRLATRLSSLKLTVVLLGATSLVIVAATLIVAGRQMFISEHDLSLLLVLIGFGVVASLAFGLTVSGPLTEDLTRIGSMSSAIAEGNLSTRTGVERLDEVGRLARDVDVMADALESAEERRAGAEMARRHMFAAVGHDLRTPLASMRAAIEALQDGLAEEPHRFLASLGADVDALSRLVENVFLLARIEAGDVDLSPDVIDMTEIADEATEVFRPLASAREVQLKLQAGERVLALGSSDAVSRVVRNLVDNAIRHSPPGGTVVIEVVNGATARCTVSDDGPGFSPWFVPRAFDGFSRGDASRGRSGGGAGLGLAIARGYVTALGGEIDAEAGPGGKVTFWLPPAPACSD